VQCVSSVNIHTQRIVAVSRVLGWLLWLICSSLSLSMGATVGHGKVWRILVVLIGWQSSIIASAIYAMHPITKKLNNQSRLLSESVNDLRNGRSSQGLTGAPLSAKPRFTSDVAICDDLRHPSEAEGDGNGGIPQQLCGISPDQWRALRNYMHNLARSIEPRAPLKFKATAAASEAEAAREEHRKGRRRPRPRPSIENALAFFAPNPQEDCSWEVPVQKERIITAQWDCGGFSNIRMAVEIALYIALKTGRTYVVPPASNWYLAECPKGRCA